MSSGKSWLNFIYVNLAFAIYIAGVFYFSQIAKIKAEWPLYRCNPMFMMLAEDVESNFIYCIQNMQTSYMGFLLEPLTFITSQASGIVSGFIKDIQMVRVMFFDAISSVMSIFQSVFGVFLNLIIEFQKITIGVRDLIGKLVGVMATLMYTIDGSVMTMQSAWNGPPGQMVQALGNCFCPKTKLKLKNGEVVIMKKINLGDVLEDGSVVETILKIDNNTKQIPLYQINNAGVNNDNIYVTGTHLVLDTNTNQFVQVSDYSKSCLTNITPKKFYCLITSTHKIKIGNEIFWDWEDHFVKAKGVFMKY